MTMKMKRHYEYLGYTAVLTVCLFVLYIVFFAVIPIDIVTFKGVTQEVLNENKTVKSGGSLSVKVRFCKNWNFQPYEGETHLIDGVNWDLNTSVKNSDVGCYETVTNYFIPEFIEKGCGLRIKRVLHFKVSPITTIDETYTTDDFCIIK